ncbi:hypothetical protein D3C71_179270 [compost metagenome]
MLCCPAWRVARAGVIAACIDSARAAASRHAAEEIFRAFANAFTASAVALVRVTA